MQRLLGPAPPVVAAGGGRASSPCETQDGPIDEVGSTMSDVLQETAGLPGPF